MTDNSKREELIEEAQKWVEEYGDGYNEFPGGPMVKYFGQELIERLAALAVFEQAHTPTNDEREARYLVEQAGSFREQAGDSSDPNSLVGLWLRTASALESALRHPVQGDPTADAVERGARAAAILGDYDGCFERIDEWNALEQWERDAHPENEPTTDYEDADFWRDRVRAALRAAFATEQGENRV